MKIQPIQTRYAGCLFRSRLEARWAVFFDALKLKWQYEPEGFDLPSGERYLPDFRIDMKRRILWVEIKPKDGPTSKMDEFMRHSPRNWYGTVLREIPDPRFVRAHYGHYYENDEPHIWGGGAEDPMDPEAPHGSWDNFYQFCLCESCGEVGFEFDGRSARIGCKCAIHIGDDKNYTPDHPIIIAAFAKARAARFEFDQRETYLTV